MEKESYGLRTWIPPSARVKADSLFRVFPSHWPGTSLSPTCEQPGAYVQQRIRPTRCQQSSAGKQKDFLRLYCRQVQKWQKWVFGSVRQVGARARLPLNSQHPSPRLRSSRQAMRSDDAGRCGAYQSLSTPLLCCVQVSGLRCRVSWRFSSRRKKA